MHSTLSIPRYPTPHHSSQDRRTDHPRTPKPEVGEDDSISLQTRVRNNYYFCSISIIVSHILLPAVITHSSPVVVDILC